PRAYLQPVRICRQQLGRRDVWAGEQRLDAVISASVQAPNQLEHFHFGLLHNDAAYSMRSLAPRSEAERGEGRVRGRFSARRPHPILPVATTEPPSPRKRGEGAITTTAWVLISHHFSNSRSRSRGAFCARVLLFGFARPTKGWRSAERRTDACEASVGP